MTNKSQVEIGYKGRLAARVISWFLSAWALMLLIGIFHAELFPELPTVSYWVTLGITVAGSLASSAFRNLNTR